MLILLFVTLLAMLGVAFLCSMTEAVLLSLNPLALKVRQQEGNPVAERWLAMKQHIERPVSAILVFNTLASTGLATFSGALFVAALGDRWLGAFSVVLTVLVLFAGELAPKIIGVHYAERLAPRLIAPLTWMLWLCHPLATVMDGFCQRLKGGAKERRADPILDIITLVQAAKAEQVLHNREEIIILHAATLSARRVRTAMVPRAAVKLFRSDEPLAANVRAQGPKLHRSYPVSVSGGLEDVTGYVRVRELFVQNLLAEGGAEWAALVRPVLRVDGRISLTQLLALFLERQEIAALVQGPTGEPVGWITLDDVTEVLMGARG